MPSSENVGNFTFTTEKNAVTTIDTSKIEMLH